jgi:hypothetical protein
MEAAAPPLTKFNFRDQELEEILNGTHKNANLSINLTIKSKDNKTSVNIKN